MKTYGRLRSKHGGTIEDVILPSLSGFLPGWHFIGEFKGKVSQNIVSRFAMLYITDEAGGGDKDEDHARCKGV